MGILYWNIVNAFQMDEDAQWFVKIHTNSEDMVFGGVCLQERWPMCSRQY